MFTRIYDWLLVSLLRLADNLIETLAPERPTPQREDMNVDWLAGYEGNSARAFILP